MLEMVYEKSGWNKPSIMLYKGNFMGYDYYIISHHTHPCAYIKLTEKDKFFGKRWNELEELNCHGGVTYSDNYLGFNPQFLPPSDEYWIIGWDYHHNNDRFDCDDYMGKSWTTKEIKQEIEEVIYQIQ